MSLILSSCHQTKTLPERLPLYLGQGHFCISIKAIMLPYNWQYFLLIIEFDCCQCPTLQDTYDIIWSFNDQTELLYDINYSAQ